jgi:hypothetical protein
VAASRTAGLAETPGVRVRRLRLRAPAGEAPAIRAALERADWPTAPGRAWVLVREVRVSATGPGLAARASERLQSLVRGAAPIDAPGAEGAEAVFCRDLAALIAALCADLAAGRAIERWYWRSWSALFGLPRGQAVARLMAEAPEVMTTVTERLARRDLLASVWRVLGPADVIALAHALAGWLGRTIPGPPGLGQGAASPGEPVLPPAGLVGRWAAPLQDLDPDDPRRWLSASLCALEWRPAALDSAEAIGAIAAALDATPTPAPGRSQDRAPRQRGAFDDRGQSDGAGRDSAETIQAPRETPVQAARRPPHPSPDSGSAHPFVPGLDRGPDSDGAPGRWRPAAANDPLTSAAGGRWPTPRVRLVGDRPRQGGIETDAGGEGRGPRPTGYATSGHGEPDPGARGGADTTPEEISPGIAERQASAPGTATAHAAAEGLAIRHGGLFYLINFLSRPEARALLAAHADSDGAPEGWALLWDLGRRLGLGPDPALAGFFAERLGLEPTASPWDLPALGIGPVLEDLGTRIYGSDLFAGPLLPVPARLHHTPSHLDLDLPLAAVRIAVRRVALDVDPGWVPWLGRVVALRYLGHWGDRPETRP